MKSHHPLITAAAEATVKLREHLSEGIAHFTQQAGSFQSLIDKSTDDDYKKRLKPIVETAKKMVSLRQRIIEVLDQFVPHQPNTFKKVYDALRTFIVYENEKRTSDKFSMGPEHSKICILRGHLDRCIKLSKEDLEKIEFESLFDQSLFKPSKNMPLRKDLARDEQEKLENYFNP